VVRSKLCSFVIMSKRNYKQAFPFDPYRGYPDFPDFEVPGVENPFAVSTEIPFPWGNSTTLTTTQEEKKRKTMKRRAVSINGSMSYKRKYSKYRTNKFDVIGSVVRSEDGGKTPGDGALNKVAIGQATAAPYENMKSLARGLYRRLFFKRNLHFNNWDDPVFSNGVLKLEFRKNPTENVENHTTPGLGTVGLTTHREVCDSQNGLLGALITAIGDRTSPFRGGYCMLVALVYLESGKELMRMPLQGAKVHMICSSNLTVQNRTVGEGADAGDKGDIENNPMIFRGYEGYGNGVKPRQNSGSHAFVGDWDRGVITGIDGLKEFGLRNKYTNCKKTMNFVINPGNIKRFYLRHEYHGSIDRFLRIMREVFDGGYVLGSYADFSVFVPFGKVRYFEAEKVCDTRSIAEPNLKIGWEVQYQCQSYVTAGAALAAFPIDNSVPRDTS